MLGLDIDQINDEIISLIRDYKIGGIVLYKKNYSDTVSMVNFINSLKKINHDNIPLFISIDQENGRVNRLPDDINRMPSALKLSGNIEKINKVNELTSLILKSVGVNMNYAPVLDILHYEDNTAIGDRSYGNNYEDVIKYGIPFMKTLTENEIISVIKHFPGHGLINGDSHFVIPKITDLNGLKKDIIPFKEAINNGSDAIMVGHLRIKGCGIKPASMNKKIIKKYLNNYNGLLITDDVMMNVMRYLFGIKRIFKDSINAGMNVIMIKYKPGLLNVIKKLYHLYSCGYFNGEKVKNSYEKIVNIKKKYNINNDIINNSLNISEINKRINDL